MAWNTGFCAFDSLSTALFPLYDLFGIIDQSRDDVTKNPLTCLGLSCALWGCAAVDPDPSQVPLSCPEVPLLYSNVVPLAGPQRVGAARDPVRRHFRLRVLGAVDLPRSARRDRRGTRQLASPLRP